MNVNDPKALKSLQETESSRYDMYTLLGEDAEECSVEYAFCAQAEVILAEDDYDHRMRPNGNQKCEFSAY